MRFQSANFGTIALRDGRIVLLVARISITIGFDICSPRVKGFRYIASRLMSLA
jgi:hypothetical protein